MRNPTMRIRWLPLLLAVVLLFSGCKVEFPQDRLTESSVSAQSLPERLDASSLPQESALPGPSQPEASSSAPAADGAEDGGTPSSPVGGGDGASASHSQPNTSSAAPSQTPDASSPGGGTGSSAPAPDTPQALTCTLTIRCDNILAHLDQLDPSRREFVPEDGVIYAARQVTFQEGETVYDLLKREAAQAGIQLTHDGSAYLQTIYITSIHNLRAKDCGETGGWMYQVNGSTPGMSCSAYRLADGDFVSWAYTVVPGDVGIVEGS